MFKLSSSYSLSSRLVDKYSVERFLLVFIMHSKLRVRCPTNDSVNIYNLTLQYGEGNIVSTTSLWGKKVNSNGEGFAV